MVKENLSSREAIDKCEKLLKKYESVFHFNHSFIVYLKYYSALMSLNGETFLLSDFDNIDVKISRLYEILKVFDIVTPGLTAMRGKCFYCFQFN